MTFRDAIRDIRELPRKSVVYVPRDTVTIDQSTDVLLVPSGGGVPDGWRYVLELWIAQEVLEVWSAWRDGRTPSLAEACEAVIYYADNDAYLADD